LSGPARAMSFSGADSQQVFVDLPRWGQHLTFPSTRRTSRYTHVVGGRYPCRSIALVPRLILAAVSHRVSNQLVVLDPFMGSGTTAIEARLANAETIGLEVDPYARLVATASTQVYTDEQLFVIERFSESVERNARKIRGFREFVPQLDNLDLWFPSTNIRKLAQIRGLIEEEFSKKSKSRGLVLAAFGDIVRAASFAERQSLKPYVSRRFPKTPGEPFRLFKSAVATYVAAASEYRKATDQFGPPLRWAKGDATNFTISKKVDLAITSPPYINAMDYVRCIRLESAWIGTGDSRIFRRVREQQVGETLRVAGTNLPEEVESLVISYSRRIAKLDPQRATIVETYFCDMLRNIRCVQRALRPGSSYFLIVGDSTIRGLNVPTHRILAGLGESVGMDWSGYFKYDIRDHRTSIPRKNRGGKIRLEHVIQLTKPR